MNPRQPGYWIVPHTHWDREWYLSFQDFRWKLVKTVDGILDTLSGDPAFVHFMLDGQTVVIDDYLELRPERRCELEGLIRSGRIAAGPWLVQPDDLLASGEALIRNLETGLARARELGGGMMVGHLPDSFGHTAALPSILHGFGIGTACLMRGPGRELDRVLFGWSAKDGSRLLVANLIDGYGNGGNLTAAAAPIDEGLAETKARQADALFEGLPVLVMDGFDHRPIDPELTRALESAGPAADAKIGSLEGYFEAAKAYLEARRGGGQEAPPLPEWKGELRSVYRAPINAGCISSRHWIKREDQEISTLLERRAEPLAALASLFGLPYPAMPLAAAWRQLLLNQAHDSICGCSIDAVHEDMRFRYAQARGIAANIANDAAACLAAALAARDDEAQESLVVAAVNPGPAREAALLSFPAAHVPDRPVLEDSAGRRYPAQLLAASGEPSVFFDEYFKPSQIRFAVGLVRHGEIMSLRVQDARSSWESEGVLRVDLRLSDTSVPTAFDWDAWMESASPLLRDARLTGVHAVGRRAGLTTVLFQAPLPAFAVKSFRLSGSAGDAAASAGSRAGDPGGPSPLRARGRTIENASLRASVASDGTLELTDKASGVVYRGIGRLVDAGDRGDEYNFDEVPGGRIVTRPARRPRAIRTRLLESGPVRATLRIDARYRVPQELAPDRRGRSRRLADLNVAVWVSLAAASRRVEMRIQVDNRARDHRLRVHFPLPGRCEASEAGGTFEIVRRPARPPGGEAPHGEAADLMHEEPTATHPFTGYVGARWNPSGGAPAGRPLEGLALLARGIREYEVLEGPSGSEIALTLFRSIGWLSRGDLFVRNDQAGPDVETPAAQEIGRHTFECAVTTYRGELAASDLPAQWDDYRVPVEVRPVERVVRRERGSEQRPSGETSLLEVDGEGLCMSSLRRLASGSLSLRFYDILGERRAVTLRLGFPIERARRTRLDGTPVGDLHVESEGRVVRTEIAPFEIVTMEIDPVGAGTVPSAEDSASDPRPS